MDTQSFRSIDLLNYARYEQPVVIIDIETTGFNMSDEIIEIGAYNILTQESWCSLVKPVRTRASATTHVTGITDDDVADAPIAADAFLDLDEFTPLDDTLFIAHNGEFFDFPRINKALTSAGFQPITSENQWDSLHIARHAIPWGTVTGHKVSTLIEYFDLPGVQSHRADSDCEYTGHILCNILDMSPDDYSYIHLPDTMDTLDMWAHTKYTPSTHEKNARKLLKTLKDMEQRDNYSLTQARAINAAYTRELHKAYGVSTLL